MKVYKIKEPGDYNLKLYGDHFICIQDLDTLCFICFNTSIEKEIYNRFNTLLLEDILIKYNEIKEKMEDHPDLKEVNEEVLLEYEELISSYINLIRNQKLKQLGI